jgi:glycerophosphoryl diester phosphodiesterase
MKDIVRIAHRGASGDGHAPENTLAAFQKAIEMGVDGVECDVHCTKDGSVVVIHDHTLNRTTDVKGTVEEMTLGEVKKADAGSWFDPRFAGERVPTLRELLKLTKGKAITVIEIKSENMADKVIKEIKDTGAESEVVIISFHASALKDAQKINPRIPRGFLIGGRKAIRRRTGILDLIQQAAEAGASILDLSSKIVTPSLVRESHLRGVGVWAWTVDDETEMKTLAEMYVDGITSNYPERLRSALLT